VAEVKKVHPENETVKAAKFPLRRSFKMNYDAPF
jgi:hypothetical protein